MFGLSVVAVAVISALGVTSAGITGAGRGSYVLNAFSSLGWLGFIALFLGWLAAMGGASQGVTHQKQLTTSQTPSNVRDIRPAA